MAVIDPAQDRQQEDSDVATLHQLGYAQELRRRMGGFSNFAVSFTIISILSGCLTAYGIAMTNGGPVDMTWGWLLVGVMTLVVGLGMAEVCSSMPTAGGLYYWSAKLAKRNGAAWSWFTGWFNLLGQVAVTAGIDYGFALFFNAFLNLTTGWSATPGHTMIIYAIVLLFHAALNIVGVRLVAFLSDVSVWWHILGVALIVIVLLAVPAHHASTSFVFTKLVNETGFHNSFYVFMIGLLLAQYTFTGYDASAHMTEETHNAAIAGPKGIVRSIWVSLIAGFVLLVGITYAITNNYQSALASTTGVPPVQIWIDAIGRHGGEWLLVVAFVAQFYCGMASVTANSRMIYAFSRDGAIPASSFWHHINPRTRTPSRAVYFAVVGVFILAIPSLWSSVAYGAVISISVIGLYIAYVIPTLLRRLAGDRFKAGPWNLGRWSPIIGWVGIVWVGIITVLFVLPTASPITWHDFNYTPVAVGVVLLYAGGFWLISARKWFTGPKAQGNEGELEAIETELERGAVNGPGGAVSVEELRHLVEAGEVDTVLLVVVDMQGRLQGKRCFARYFLDEVVPHAAEACNYLLAVDVDMRTVGGYAMSSWERGYGDFVMRPDLATLRLVPWHEATALCVADIEWEDGSPVVASPRQILRRQADRLGERGWRGLAGTELEFIVFRDTYEGAWSRGYRDLTPANLYNVDYSMLGTSRVEPLLRRIRNEMAGAGLQPESAKGECNLGQHEIAFRYGELLDTADGHALYKTGAKEIAAQEGMSLTFMAKYDEREGNSCHIHLSLRDADGRPVFACDDDGVPNGVFGAFMAGMLATLPEMTLLLAPNINSYKRYAEGSFAPTAIAWGHDNRTCALRVVGHGSSLRVENRVPGADVNPYLALAALVAGGLHGIDTGLGLEPPQSGNAYVARHLPRVPGTLADAAALFEHGTVARSAFGDEVVEHYANMARVELAAFASSVTDWERYRGFERL